MYTHSSLFSPVFIAFIITCTLTLYLSVYRIKRIDSCLLDIRQAPQARNADVRNVSTL